MDDRGKGRTTGERGVDVGNKVYDTGVYTVGDGGRNRTTEEREEGGGRYGGKG